MLDKNLSEKQWEKIFLSHTFLNKMLRNKIEREMEKFRIVEFSFKEIKTATVILKVISGSQRCSSPCKQVLE